MQPVGFGYKTAWIACRDRTPADVASALALADLSASDWAGGIAEAQAFKPPGNEGAIFVTPPIEGWVLAMGAPLLTLCDSRPPSFAGWLGSLSRRLDGADVQFFATHRISEAHAWGRAVDGKLIRAYQFVGSEGATYIDFGPQSTAEQALGFRFFDERVAAADGCDDLLQFPGEDHVMQLAAEWSLDPTSLDQRTDCIAEPGLRGLIALRPAARRSPPGADAPERDDDPKPARRWWKLW